MVGRLPVNLTGLEALALVRNSRPAELSAEQITAIRVALAESPALSGAAYDSAVVEQFLREADTLAVVADSKESSPVRPRRWGWILALAACAVVLAGVAYWRYPKNPEPSAPPSLVENNPAVKASQPPPKIEVKQAAKAEKIPDAEPDNILAWHDWKIVKQVGAEATREWRWDLSNPARDRADECLRIGGGAVTLSDERDLPAGERWLVIDVSQTAQVPRSGTIEVRVDGKALSRFELPEIKTDSQYAVSLGPPQPRRARLEVEFLPGSPAERVVMQRVSVVGDRKFAETGTTIVPLIAQDNATPAVSGKTIEYFPSPYPLFEDEGNFQAVAGEETDPKDDGKNTGGTVEIVKDQRYTGAAAVRVTPSGEFHLAFKQPMAISDYPRQNEFRYLRFAVRAQGGGRAVLELKHGASAVRPARYELGPAKSADGSAFHAWEQELPDGWIVVTRDLFRDVGQATASGITIRKLDGGESRFDHVYLARTLEQFNKTPPAPAQPIALLEPPIPDGPVVDAPERAIVALDAGDRVATGTIVSEEGYILTAAHLVAGPTKQIIAHFSDGTQQPCKVICYRRDFNLGVVKISGRPRLWPYLNMATASMFGDKRIYRAFSYRFNYKEGDKPLAIQIPAHIPFAGRAQVGDVQWELACGGPVLGPDGSIVGINTGPDMRGGLGYLPIEYARDNWPQLSTGVPGPGGDWDQYSRPVLGLAYEAIPNSPGLKVTAVEGHWPVARSGVKVGDVIMLADGKKVSPFDLGIYVLKHEPGETMKLTIHRPETEKPHVEIAVVLGRRP